MKYLLFALICGCAPDLDRTHDWSDVPPDDPFADRADGARVILVHEDDQVRAQVDASDPDIWVDLDLDEDGVWDLRLRRFEIASNGGISGDGGVQAQRVEDGDLLAPGEPDPARWRVDAADGPDEDSDADLALSTWYLYDETTHVLTPAPGVWWVRCTSQTQVVLVIDDYYDEWGTSARFALTWTTS